jgi:recombination associated protein RdgC
MFKSVVVYVVTPGYKLDSEILNRRPARPCTGFEMATDGFVAPCQHSTNGLVHSVGSNHVICLETEARILPGNVVNELVAERIEAIESNEGRKVGRKEGKEIRERITEELLPKAFVQHHRTLAVMTEKYLLVDASNASRVDTMIEALMKTHEQGIPVRFLQVNVAPPSAMTQWVIDNTAPAEFSLDSDLELRTATDAKSSIRYTNHTICGPEVAEHIAAGKIATKLAMTWNDRMSFLLTDKLHLKRIAFLDVVQEEKAMQQEDAAKSADVVFDADITLLAGELSKVIDDLVAALGGLCEPKKDLLSECESVEKAVS